MEPTMLIAIITALLTKGPKIFFAWAKAIKGDTPTREEVKALQDMKTPDDILGPPDGG